MKPVRVNKRQKPTNKDLFSRASYVEENNSSCELCGRKGTWQYDLDIHHIYPQQKIYWEHPDNYVLLCRYTCHAWVENTGSQLERELAKKPAIGKRFKGMSATEIKVLIKKNWRELELWQ